MSNIEYSDKKVPQDQPESDLSRALPRGVLAGSAIIFICAVLAYYPSLRGGFILDDNFLLTENNIIKAPDGLYRFWFTAASTDYWPVTNTMLWFEWRMWGKNPVGYRAVNLAIHITEALLIWYILWKLSIPGAFLAAMLFAVHPVNVESVAWISQRKDMLAMLYFLLSILCYFKHARSHGGPWERVKQGAAPRRPENTRRETASGFLHPSSFIPHPSGFYWLSLLLFILAMLSKGSVAIMPALILGITWWLRPLTRWDLIRTVPFFAVSAVLSMVNIWFQTHGSGDVLRTAGFTERLLGAGGIVWFYLFKAILPFNLLFVYPQWQIRIGNPLWWLPIFGALAVTAVLWRYRKGWSRPFLFAWGFFCVSLAPVMGFADIGFMQYSLVADHYQHIAIIGVIALAAAGYSLWHRNASKEAALAASVIAIFAVATLGFLTWRQSALYTDAKKLYQATLEKNPDCWFIQLNLGGEFYIEGRKKEAVEYYLKALTLKPDVFRAYYNLGTLSVDEGRVPEAIDYFRKAIKSNPFYPEAYNSLGEAWLKSGNAREAVSCFEHALQIKPYFPEAINNLALALTQTGRLQEAIDNYTKALSIKPDDAGAQNNLGTVLALTGRLPEAIEHFKKAIQLTPKDADINKNLGMAMAGTDRPQEAIKLFEQALAIKSDFPEAHYRLGLVLVDLGRKREAIEHFEQALRFDANHPEIQYNLGLNLVDIGRVQEAIERFKQVIELKPDFIDAYTNLMLAYAMLDQSAEAVATAQKALEVTRSTGKLEQAKKIEDWLKSYHAGQGILPSTVPSSKSAFPGP
jgi:protein O-mannosyl-transferase